ncbi:hypothetical protein ATPR_1862 [Acetobacter tropicalis NBRC 101654]|uniref:Transposase n=1 Tax=Acetobacter tropicalis NBRC 101654 TaxID=749388 RepID=F7VER3_9PROT|nr:hypothetical protein ATPR_1862 [Acetobacter tropicalis NBRC 101654]
MARPSDRKSEKVGHVEIGPTCLLDVRLSWLQSDFSAGFSASLDAQHTEVRRY